MNDIYITLTGNVAAEPRQYTFEDGARVTSLRVLTSHRYFDRKTGQWTDGERVCFAVRCWRSLGDNVARSIRMGHPVVVSGKLRIREFGPEGDRRFMPEIEASAVGHDLRWGAGTFVKPERGGGPATVSKEMRDRLDAETEDWAMGASGYTGGGRSAMGGGGAAMAGGESAAGGGRAAVAGAGAVPGDDAATVPGNGGVGAATGGGPAQPRPSFPEPPAMTPLPPAPADHAEEPEVPSQNDQLGAPQKDGHLVTANAEAHMTAAAAAPAPGKASSKPARAKSRSSRAGSTSLHILGEDDNERESEDAEWPTSEPIAA
ncbi:single-stranded DNA-binding protein [Nonomuraea sp. NPDC050691]|uniref:single-stranded DNA-binding protein n=1 Tax=Nonomuraea sp. NPDC050691 TaxID=3155661 RepID=UPI0033EDF9D1